MHARSRPVHLWGEPYLTRPRLRSGEALQVVLGVAEGLADHGEPTERVADLELLGHAHAAVQLHRFLAHVAARVGYLDLGRGDGVATLACRGRVHLDAGEIGHGSR